MTTTTTNIANLLRREVRKFKPGESEPLPEGSAGGLNAAASPEKRKKLVKNIFQENEKVVADQKMISILRKMMRPCLL